jgi:cell division transport system ATP-binding protein
VIQFEHVSKRYKAQSAPALDDISLEIEDGEFTFLVGPSGSGKSTFLRLLLREEKATSGEVIVNGKDIAKMRSWKVGIPPGHENRVSSFRLLPEDSDKCRVRAKVIGAPKSAVGPAVADALDLVGLTEMADRKPGQLSVVSSSASHWLARS